MFSDYSKKFKLLILKEIVYIWKIEKFFLYLMFKIIDNLTSVFSRSGFIYFKIRDIYEKLLENAILDNLYVFDSMK